MNKSLYEQMLLSLLGKYLGMKWLDHMVRLCLIFKKPAKLFFKVIVPFNIPTSFVREFQLPHSLSSICLWCVFIKISDMKRSSAQVTLTPGREQAEIHAELSRPGILHRGHKLAWLLGEL